LVIGPFIDGCIGNFTCKKKNYFMIKSQCINSGWTVDFVILCL